MAPSPEALIDQIVAASPSTPRYAAAQDRESAFERLSAAAATAEAAATQAAAAEAAAKADADAAKAAEAAAKAQAAAERQAARREREDPTVVEQVVGSSVFKSMLRSAGTVIGREITRSIFGTSRRR
jgi:membrane protein involved in colicin uptake